ncbi:CubicO group peptidase, beta-lactamase class C family [Paenibacillus uliginis N3/975]|uniref:CubicO group peptidase, beta-lactamase class C family n=1 Tax=Paenibacillus uliginis N3/975 TaxID=1313296 RepID=A0A1X7HTD8_9BACL|nr:serine hydrolase domain-containing protein [Paenibacillus uliginis]SMF91575.1 CubicO group peptidase, beta-lactamase class C family [Paenibacillus uliginis N3/975]
MKKRLSWLLSVTLVLMLLIPTAAMASTGSNVTVSNQGLEKIASEKATLLTEKYGTVSVQYALIDNGKITVSGQAGHNDMEGKKPLTKDTMYGIGSTSKVFTTAAVMKLVDEGKINLDTPVVEYIADFKMKDERYKKITPRMLLNHSSGLQGSSLRGAFLFDDNDKSAHDTLLQQLSTQSLKADPGAFSVYCNDGFTLAEILVERVSGKDFTAFIHQYFTKALEMNHTKTSQDVLEADKMAGLYYPTYEGQLPNETVNVIGTGGIYSTAEDLVRFSQIFTGQVDGILSDKSVRAMEQEEYKKGLWPKEADNSFDYGLGWDSVRLFPFNDYGMKGLVKGGDTILYHASLVVLPEQDMAAAVLSSGGSSSTNELLANELLLQAMKEKGTIKEIKAEKSFGKPVKASMPEDVMKHAGYYGASNQQLQVVVNKNGELSLSNPLVPNTPEQKFVYTSDGSFVNEDGGSKLSFVKEKNGRTYLWAREYLTVPGLGQMALSHYTAEKLEEHTLSPETAEAWAKREGKTYYPVNEKYTSLMYLIMKPTMQIDRTDDLPGYLLDKKITSPITAASELQIPAMGGRDLFELRFDTKDGVEYLEASGSLYVSEEQVKPLYKGKQSSVNLNSDGHAKWYTVPAATVGKTMTVEMPAKGAFAVYDEQGVCVNYTVVSGKNEVKLPENGTIVFAGAAGSTFGITLK